MKLIELHNISKEFKTFKKKPGLINSVKSLFYRKYEIKQALKDINLQIEKGEIVGYIGPNGAGKSTTIKILSGILLPTSGEVYVNNIIPFKNRKKNAYSIGVVFGQRTHLHWDLPVNDSYELYKKIYRIEQKKFIHNYDFLVESLEMKDFVHKPVRQLSLGQKMRAEIGSALLHDPEILYLDEPTIGLDVLAKSWVRKFLREINKEKKTTILLTTHDMDDIEQICNRIVMIDKGKILFDGSINNFKQTYGGEHLVIADFTTQDINLTDNRLKIIKNEGERKYITFKQSDISLAETVTFLTRNFNIKDLTIKEPDIENIVKKIYENK